jgi:amino-acid N-acetyltransferase
VLLNHLGMHGDDHEIVTLPALPAHRTQVVALLRASGLPTEDVPAHLPHFFVAEAGGAIVGAVGLEVLDERALFRSLAVAPAWRGHGVAHLLWHKTQQHALAIGVRELYLLTTTAAALFARWGFAPVPRAGAPDVVRATAEFRTLCPDSATVMRFSFAAATSRGCETRSA